MWEFEDNVEASVLVHSRNNLCGRGTVSDGSAGREVSLTDGILSVQHTQLHMKRFW